VSQLGIQEYSGFNEALREVFHGCSVLKNGYVYVNEAPGWGIEVDESWPQNTPTAAWKRKRSAG